MGYLAGRVHTGVGAACREKPHRRAEDRRERFVEDTGDGALALLNRPSGEIRAVVGDIEAEPN